MIIWGIFWGAVLGIFWPGMGDVGIFAGAFFGFFIGLSARWAVRREVAAQRKKDWQAVAVQPAAEPAVVTVSAASTLPHAQAVRSAEAAATSSVQAASGSAAANEAAAASRDVPLKAAPVPRAPATAPAAPAAPGAIDLAILAAKNWLLGGNTIVRVGLVILFIGLSFLARYAATAGLFPVEFRLAAIGVAAIVLLGVGFTKRHARPGFALALQGGGVAVLYLTVFAAFRLYGLMPPLLAFGLMIVVCALSCALALLQDSRALAVAAFAGGFAVPLLLSTGEGSHVGLFSYYTVLNLAILFIAHQRSWRILNAVGFVATFGVATAWGVLKYAPAQYASTQPFLVAFVLIYVAAAVLYARNTPTRLGNAVDSLLVFGTPLAGFGLQAGLVQQFELGAAFSALAFAAGYLMLAGVLVRRGPGNYRLLMESFLALGVGFVTLAVPLALDTRWTSGTWALEGAAAFWLGMRQARWMPRAFGLAMQVVAALVFFSGPDTNVSAWPFANPGFLGAMLVALPAAFTAWLLRRPLPHSDSRLARLYAAVEVQLSSPVFIFAFVFWCLGWALEIQRRLPPVELDAAAVAVFSMRTAGLLVMLEIVLSACLAMLLGLRTRWAVATWPARFSLPVMALALLVQGAAGGRVLHTPAWAIWPAVLVLHYWMLRKLDALPALWAQAPAPAGAALLPALTITRILHVGSAWLVTVLLADALWFWIGKGDLWSTSWAGVVLLVAAIAVLLFLAVWAGRASDEASRASFGWPRHPHAPVYYWHAALPLAALVFAGALAVALQSSGRTDPLPYIPLLNPTDLTLALALAALVFWRRVVVSATPTPPGFAWVRGPRALAAVAVLAFVAVNTVWLRVAHHFFGVSWDAGALFNSFVVQTGYAILWTLLALSLMVTAHRRVQRPLWLVGAGLLGLTVVKLLLVDLSNVGGAERIITFIVVGVLMLVVGYFAPLPPKTPAAPVPDGGQLPVSSTPLTPSTEAGLA